MDGVLPKSQLSTCFRSKANAKANRSIKLHPITREPVLHHKDDSSGKIKISQKKKLEHDKNKQTHRCYLRRSTKEKENGVDDTISRENYYYLF